MNVLAVLLLAVAQDPVERLVERLSSDRIEERERADVELLRRAEAAMDALEGALRKSVQREDKERLHRSLESIVGGKVLPLDRVKSASVKYRSGPRSLAETVRELQRLTQLSIQVSGNPPADPTVPAVAFEGSPLDAALDSLTRRIGALWLIEGERIVILAPGKVAVRLFDVRDLTSSWRDEPLLSLEPDPGPAAAEAEGHQELTGEDIANLVKASVEKDKWEEADGKAIQYQNGWLIVRNEPPHLAAVEELLDAYRRRFMARVRVEVEAFLCQPGTEVTDDSIEALRKLAAEGKSARRAAFFQRTPRDKRRVALASVTRSFFATRYDASGKPVLQEFSTGLKMNLRASLGSDGQRVRVEMQAAFSKLAGVERKKTAQGEVQTPTVANHVISSTETVPVGRTVVLGRIQGAGIDEALAEIVILGRFAASR